MSKELFIAAHEDLVTEYLEKHPNATWDEAYDRTADHALASSDHMRERLFGRADHLRKSKRERQS